LLASIIYLPSTRKRISYAIKLSQLATTVGQPTR
jgi:hypothetical protein